MLRLVHILLLFLHSSHPTKMAALLTSVSGLSFVGFTKKDHLAPASERGAAYLLRSETPNSRFASRAVCTPGRLSWDLKL